MRIINREEFLKLPEGVLYTEYRPIFFSGLCIKGKSLEVDYEELNLFEDVGDAGSSEERFDLLDRMVATGESQDVDFSWYGRNGMFEKDILYPIIEQKDLDNFLTHLYRQGYYKKENN